MYSVQLKSTDSETSRIQGSIPSSGRKFISSPEHPALTHVYWGSYPCGVMWPAHLAHLHLMPSLRTSGAISLNTFMACTWTLHCHTVPFTCTKIQKKTLNWRYPSAPFKKMKKVFSKMVPIFIYKASKQVSISQFHYVSEHYFRTAPFQLVKFRRRPPSNIQVNMTMLQISNNVLPKI